MTVSKPSGSATVSYTHLDVYKRQDIEQSMSGKFEINPQNATQLLCDGTVYQVTSDTVSNNELGSYIGIPVSYTHLAVPGRKNSLRNFQKGGL